MLTKSNIVLMLAGIAVGAGIALVTKPESAVAQLSSQAGTWQLGVRNSEGLAVSWRLNTVTGAMEMCSAPGGTPNCLVMPRPSSN